MKNKLLLLAMGIALTTQTLIAQGVSSYSNLWYNKYSNGISQNGIGIFTRGTFDNGNLIVAGSSWNSWPSGTRDQLITKISNTGSVIFQTLRSPGGDHDTFDAACVLDNGSYAFFGQQNAQGTQYFDGFYCVFNPNGVEQSYDFFSISGSSSGSDMKKLPNGNLVFTGNHGGGNNYISLSSQNFVESQYKTFNVSNNGWNSGYLAVDDVNNFIYAIADEVNTNALQIKKYDFNLNLINSYTINETNPFKCYDVAIMNGNLWLCGYKLISNNKYATVIKIDSNGVISDINTSNLTSEYTSIINYSDNIILSKSNLSGNLSTSNELNTYRGGNNFGPSTVLNSGNPFVPYDLAIDQNYIYCIGVQGQNYYVGIPAIQKLKIESVTYSDTCNNVSGSLTQGLVGYWPFCGNANDDSGKGNNGTVNGATLTTDRFGNSNSAYNFDGINDLISIPDSNTLSITNNITMSAWVYVNSDNQNYHSMLYKRLNGNWSYNLSLSYYFGPGGSPTEVKKVFSGRRNNFGAQLEYKFSNEPIVFGQWFHITVKIENNMITFYKNGIDMGVNLFGNQFTIPMINQAIGLTIGSNGDGGEWFNGKLDDIGIWNRALTQEEITNLYNQNQCFTNTTVTDTLIINVGQLSYTNPIAYSNNITIAPNPASSQININFNNITDLNGGTLKVINSLGQQVATTPIITTGKQSIMQLATWGGSGMYFVQIINPQGQIVDIKKIILQ